MSETTRVTHYSTLHTTLYYSTHYTTLLYITLHTTLYYSTLHTTLLYTLHYSTLTLVRIGEGTHTHTPSFLHSTLVPSLNNITTHARATARLARPPCMPGRFPSSSSSWRHCLPEQDGLRQGNWNWNWIWIGFGFGFGFKFGIDTLARR